MVTKNTQKGKKQGVQAVIESTHSNIQDLVKTDFLGVELTDASESEVLEYIAEILQKSQKNIYVVTPNPEIFMQSLKNSSLKSAINSANLALIDGVGLQIGGQIVGIPLHNRIIGTNLMENLCRQVADWPITVGFLGGRPGVAEKASECLRKKYSGLKVSFAQEEWDESSSHAKVDILFIAFGAPKQEIWMQEHINKIPVRVMMGVGGAFDQIIDSSLRPPKGISSIGLGWLYRLIRQPWRWRRQLALISFGVYIVKKKISG